MTEDSPVRGRISAVLDRGDVFTANEYMQYALNHQELPAPLGEERDVFREFFPELWQHATARS